MLRNSVRTTRTPKTTFARTLRKNCTPGEELLWNKLRAKRFHELKFRRQVPIGPYIVDFLCVDKRLIIEIDGDSHYQQGAQERDRRREEYLYTKGFTILRVGEWETVHELDVVLEKIGGELGCYSE